MLSIKNLHRHFKHKSAKKIKSKQHFCFICEKDHENGWRGLTLEKKSLMVFMTCNK